MDPFIDERINLTLQRLSTSGQGLRDKKLDFRILDSHTSHYLSEGLTITRHNTSPSLVALDLISDTDLYLNSTP